MAPIRHLHLIFTTKSVNRWMMLHRPILLAIAFFFAASAADARDDADCITCAKGEAIDIATELRIEIRTQLNFSRATVTKQGGKIRVDPQTGGRAVDGGVVDLGGMALAGNAVVNGSPGKMVRIEIPSTVRMSNARGGALIIRNLRTNLSAAPRLDSVGNLEFAFGGDLEISGDAYGDYRGRIPITAEYE
jgi:Domain of unknown function (DUF4402)